MFYLFYAFIWLITWLPLRVLYFISDFFFLIVYYLVGYRKKVVRINLEKSFPNKTKKEKRRIERRFYRFFCDLFVETMYEMHIGEKEISHRMTYSNIEGILEQYGKGKSVMIMTAHYGNWEWTLGFPLFMPGAYASNPIYKQLKNKGFDKLIYSLRSKHGAELIEKKDLLRVMFQLKKEEKLANFCMISDQTPNGKNIHYWTKFLNQDTPVLSGTEVLARKFDYPVYYGEITRIKRGYYKCKLIPISLEPTQTSEFEIIENYMRLLEKTIVANPEYWLWTHRRWKYQRNLISNNSLT